MRIDGVKRLAENAIAFAERIDFPVAVSGDEHSDAIQSLGFAIKGLADIVKSQQLIIDTLCKDK